MNFFKFSKFSSDSNLILNVNMSQKFIFTEKYGYYWYKNKNIPTFKITKVNLYKKAYNFVYFY